MKVEEKITIIANQLIAYNEKNIDRFISYWDENAKVYLHPDNLIAVGIDEIRNRHVERFKEKDLFAKLISRCVIDDKIVDIEIVTRNFPEGKCFVDVLAIYDIKNFKIMNAWFIIGKPKIENL
ncbi:steroid delta-isomerase [Leptospira bandrabouensis]|uniref:nuclear transport factor 2 family protein n=1 Tax=Leptospira bandrabouensis TaxID=2484903 RepID=UPI001EE97776|nr:steroid delta-isomerase [Leptospira bandrabouensis]MCG6146579.1 steroid delta-isomerase [Leptospira bandrabouensis]MCG6161960.1 steroid delta-isomerase [Leptospira bandrabouensis]MCG6166147.1 steroid delta-isomerase [Leptospira bandrabouensis]